MPEVIQPTAIYHLAPAERWQHWPRDTAYLPAQYQDDGFIHCTAGDDLMLQVANRFYQSEPGAFVLLVIDPTRLTAELRWEHAADELNSDFPHIYGPINLDAVVEVCQVERAADGTFLGWARTI